MKKLIPIKTAALLFPLAFVAALVAHQIPVHTGQVGVNAIELFFGAIEVFAFIGGVVCVVKAITDRMD